MRKPAQISIRLDSETGDFVLKPLGKLKSVLINAGKLKEREIRVPDDVTHRYLLALLSSADKEALQGIGDGEIIADVSPWEFVENYIEHGAGNKILPKSWQRQK